MFGTDADNVTDASGETKQKRMELVRLAIPRRVYTQSHMDYVIEAVTEVFQQRDRIRGMRIVEAPPVLHSQVRGDLRNVCKTYKYVEIGKQFIALSLVRCLLKTHLMMRSSATLRKS